MSNTESWLDLLERLRTCSRCHSEGLLYPKAKPLFCKYKRQRADLLFILEAPNHDDTTKFGYLTYDRETDPTGSFFRELYMNVLCEPIENAAVTNSVLCLPAVKGEKSTKYPVNARLARNCSEHLRAQVTSLDPLVVVTLGVPALSATRRIEDHGHRKMRKAVGIPRPWFNRTLLPLYHPGLQVRNNRQTGRSSEEQRRDWLGLRELLANERALAPRRA